MFSLSHICLLTTNLERLIDFYHGKLELEKAWESKNSSGELIGYCVQLANRTKIEMFPVDPAIRIHGNSIAHICFKVEDLDYCRKWLLDRGVAVEKYVINQEFWIFDPDGNQIEIRLD